MSVERRQLSLEGVQIGFRNFSGEESMYNKAGDRNFVVFLDPETATDLLAEGWNVKFPKEREDGPDEEDARQPYLPVDLGSGKFPPKVVMIANDVATKLEGDAVSDLDWVEIENVDLVVRPYNWTFNGRTGTKAYLKALYVTIATDDFQKKYGI